MPGLPGTAARPAMPAAARGRARRWPGSDRKGTALERAVDADDVESLHPREVARRLEHMRPDIALRVLAGASVAASAEVLDVLLRDDEELVVQILAHARRSKARELIAAMNSPPDWLKDLPDAADAIEKRERDLRAKLGQSTGSLSHSESRARTHGYLQNYESGQIHWSRLGGGAQAVRGSIGKRYRALGGVSNGLLGFPLTAEGDAQPSGVSGIKGRLQRFEGAATYRRDLREDAEVPFSATIYWSAKHAAHPTWGAIGEFYEKEHGTGGWLGFPTSGEIKAGPSDRDDGKGTTGVYQRFEGGSVYYSRKTRVIAVPLPIADHLERHHDGVTGAQGFPVSPRMQAGPSPYGTEGHYQRFEGKWDYPQDIISRWTDNERPGGASIYTSEDHGTHCVGWVNGILYERLGGTTSWLGFPKSDETTVPASGNEPQHTIQEFEGGAVYHTAKHDSVTVPKASMDYLAEHPGIRKQLGVPVKRPQNSPPDAPVQFFEHGVITNNDGQINAWAPATAIHGPDPEEIDLTALDCSTGTASGGQTISLEYTIRSRSDHTVLVGLGASLIAGNGDDYFDTATDRHVLLTPGEASYCRRLQIPPATPEGTYRLVGGVWYPNFGDQRLAGIDCGFILTVSAEPGGAPNRESGEN
jgi:LGFP repeat